MPRGGENHAQGGEISRALRARRTVYFFPPWAILVVALNPPNNYYEYHFGIASVTIIYLFSASVRI